MATLIYNDCNKIWISWGGPRNSKWYLTPRRDVALWSDHKGQDLHNTWMSPGEGCRTKRSWVQVHCSSKVAIQVDRMVKKAFIMLTFIGRRIANKRWDIMMQLDKLLLETTLGLLWTVLVAQLRKDIIKLERVHKRFIQMLPRLAGVTEWLDRLGLFSFGDLEAAGSPYWSLQNHEGTGKKSA